MIGLYSHNLEDSSNPFTKCPVGASFATSPNHKTVCVYFALEVVSKLPQFNALYYLCTQLCAVQAV